MTTVARQIVATLRAHGVDRAFCVAGESYLAMLDALYDTLTVDPPGIDVVTCRHEGSAGLAALADAKLTGRAGVALVSRGPGATNAALAVFAAAHDATPLVLLVGQSRLADLDGPAFQEVDCGALFGGLAKGVWTVRAPTRAAELTARAIRVAESGTPGPTVLVLPEDVLAAPVPGPAMPAVGQVPQPAAVPHIAELSALLGGAARPLLVVGSGVASPAGRELVPLVADRHVTAVACSAKRQDLYDNTDPHYAGHLHLATPGWQRTALGEADLIVAVGTRLDAVTTKDYTLPRAPVPVQPLVHVHADPAAIGRVYSPTVALVADPTALLRVLSTLDGPDPQRRAGRRSWVADLHAQETTQATWVDTAAEDGVVFGAVVAALDRLTAGAATIAVDAGNFTSWLHRYYRFRGGGRLLGLAPGAMGFGVPAGLAAALRHPDRQTVAVVGDGGVQMTGAELATAVARRVRLCVVIADNGSYGTIRQHQERAYPGRVIATELANPDFAAWAAAHGALGLAVTDDAGIEPALKQALDHNGPAVVTVRTSLRHISAYGRLGA